jgi:microcystin degradation protein MlrC|tara:strand:+ start:970 stop:2433 length:1464 start_codon:yes stop_codon:yes gene_type:complete
MYKIVIASFLQETNTFSPNKTTLSDFNFSEGNDFYLNALKEKTEVKGFISILKKEKVKIIPLMGGWAVSSGKIKKKDFKIIINKFLLSIKKIKKFDGLLLALHGSCAAEGCDSVDSYLIEKIRNIIGNKIPIMISLDLHANITRSMQKNTNAIVGYKTCPHTDIYETGKKTAELMISRLKNKIKPKTILQKLPMITQAENHLTDRGIFKKLIQKTKKYEKIPNILSVSIFAMQPWLDVKEAGWAITIVANNDDLKAKKLAKMLAEEVWSERFSFLLKLPTPSNALKYGMTIKGGPITLGEGADATMGGSTGDGLWILKSILKNKLDKQKCAVVVVDKQAVNKAIKLGLNKTIRLKIGGSLNHTYNQPINIFGKIIKISNGIFTYKGKVYTGRTVNMGNAVVIKINNVNLLVAEKSMPTTDPEMYRSQGIEPSKMKFVVVKSPLGLWTEYEPISKAVISVDTPGSCRADLTKLPFKKIPKSFFPFNQK